MLWLTASDECTSSVHLFWLALLVPAVILSQWIWPVLKQRAIWFVLTLVVGVLLTIWLAMNVLPTESAQRTVFEFW